MVTVKTRRENGGFVFYTEKVEVRVNEQDKTIVVAPTEALKGSLSLRIVNKSRRHLITKYAVMLGQVRMTLRVNSQRRGKRDVMLYAAH